MAIKSLLPEEVVIELPKDYESDEEKPFLLDFLEEHEFSKSKILASKTTLFTSHGQDLLEYD